MPASLVASQILLILLPGFSAAYIVQLFALRNTQTDFDKVVEACLYSAFAVAGAAYINLDGNALFRKLKITERTTRRSIWNDIFEKEAKAIQVVQVELDDGRSILGVLTYYSDSADDCSVYIEQASWVDGSGKKTAIPGPGVLLTKNATIKSISLLDN